MELLSLSYRFMQIFKHMSLSKGISSNWLDKIVLFLKHTIHLFQLSSFTVLLKYFKSENDVLKYFL